jgi:pilus assembly protein CpaE
MPVYLFHEDAGSGKQQHIFERLRPAIPDLVETASLDAVLKARPQADQKEPTIILVAVSAGDRGDIDRLAELAGRYSKDLFFILIGEEISASDYKRLVRSGGADWASVSADPSEVAEIIARRRRESENQYAVTRPIGSRPIAISFVPSAGGVGNTTLIIEAAAQIVGDRSASQRKVCIVDLDFQSSNVCDYLDSEPRLQIAEFSSAPERLDEHLFGSFRTRHSSGIDIFASPRSKFYSDDLNINALDALFTMIAKHYELVFIDYPLTWFPWTTQIIAASDGAIVTGINTIPCLRQVSETLGLVRSSGSAGLQIGIAINRCERSMLGSIARRRHAEMALRDERLFFIGNRPEAVESINVGATMTSGSSGRLRKDFGQLAEFCSELKAGRFLSG